MLQQKTGDLGIIFSYCLTRRPMTLEQELHHQTAAEKPETRIQIGSTAQPARET